ncbi:family 16 glycosylhydrolase [Hymenobacter sp. HMF4947]|uniref:Family 16 glycosylhydrolase n=1 Tax=Hymenobacter ginkgonis TaxID=2682976 RepID=A0A7K1TAY6_9BACT|nr:family 16 glycosylhydrolase [Hymenobacter ginkgonis]MVN75564.1 family 16 glycosylhydrolase [Hymenobacter ginkgonis]
MRRTLTSLLGAAGLLLLGTPRTTQAQTYQQVWADEFTNGISSSWQFETGNNSGWGNNEKQYYQAANATVANGALQITAKKQSVGGFAYTSARMKTQGLKDFKYGRMEARIKLPLGQGLWPGFWMLGSNINSVAWPRCGEIDIMEHVNADNTIFGTAHWDSNGHAQYGKTTTTTAGDWHVYSIEWTPTFIKWFVDGAQYNVMDITNGTGSTEEFQSPFFILLNLAVGGNLPGQTIDESKLPATMYVDYVRVSQLTSAPAASSITLQAEAANVNSGMTAETTSDTGGGQDMGYVDAGDYLVFNNINFPTSGTYTLEYRVASPSGGTVSSDLNAGSVQLGSTTIPATGGWQTWTTVSKTVTVNAGTYNFGVYAQTGGWNINWVRISKVSGAREALAATSAAAQPEANVFPNPVAPGERLQTGAALVGSQYQILDAIGRLQSQGTVGSNGLDVSSLRAGMYTLRLVTPQQEPLSRSFSKR